MTFDFLLYRLPVLISHIYFYIYANRFFVLGYNDYND